MNFHVPESHPRYHSLLMRERIIDGWKAGMVADAGLIAHGRGEAFDYLLGERTWPFAVEAARAAAATIRMARHPVISVNGNVAALCPEGVRELAVASDARIEVNLFYRTEERVRRIVDHLGSAGIGNVLGPDPDAEIPGLDHARRLCASDGIHSADAVFVPLEDGDRVQALVDAGKTVICVDLNPLSRSARCASITIVDNVVRAMPLVARELRSISRQDAAAILGNYDNHRILAGAMAHISSSLREKGEFIVEDGGGSPAP